MSQKKKRSKVRVVLGIGYAHLFKDTIYQNGVIRLTDKEAWKSLRLKNGILVNRKKVRLIAEIL